MKCLSVHRAMAWSMVEAGRRVVPGKPDLAWETDDLVVIRALEPWDTSYVAILELLGLTVDQEAALPFRILAAAQGLHIRRVEQLDDGQRRWISGRRLVAVLGDVEPLSISLLWTGGKVRPPRGYEAILKNLPGTFTRQVRALLRKRG